MLFEVNPTDGSTFFGAAALGAAESVRVHDAEPSVPEARPDAAVAHERLAPDAVLLVLGIEEDIAGLYRQRSDPVG
jgi:hypothetical protein